MLHTINQSPFRNTTLETAMRFIQANDPVLFLEDGVYAVSENGRFKDLVQKLMQTNPVYVLGPDLKARGVGSVIKDVKEVDYDGFVELVEQHQVNTWL